MGCYSLYKILQEAHENELSSFLMKEVPQRKLGNKEDVQAELERIHLYSYY